MAKYLFLVFALSVITFSKFRLVQCADQCKTHADCKTHFARKYCCGGYAYWGSRDRSCMYDWCLNQYCSSDSDCGSLSLRCDSNKCVNKGFSGCTKETDCSYSDVCCKKTFPLDQTICAANCINQICNSNDDCAGQGECCRSGKCTTGCDGKCTADSECDLDQYCCKTKQSTYWRDDHCAKTCVGEMCRIDSDCGARNECCISGKCVDRGCSGCVNNSDCSTGHYCCKKRQWYTNELSECSANCIGKSCGTNDDCGGPDETCASNYECAVEQKSDTSSFPPWLIAVLTVSLILFFVAVGILVAVVWYFQKKRPANTPQRGSVPLQNTQCQGGQVQNQQADTSGLNNPTAYQNQLSHSGNVAHPSHNPSTVYPGRFQNGAQAASSHGLPFQNPTQHGFENFGYHPHPSQTNGQQGRNNEGHQYNNLLHDQFCPTLERPDEKRGMQYQDDSGQQVYPQNAPPQFTSYPQNPPPYNPQYQGNP